MADTVRALLKGKIYARKIDIEEVADTSDVIKAFRVRSFNDMNCRQCPYMEHRFSRQHCAPCANYLGKIDMAEEVRIDNKNYISLPLGSQHIIEKLLDVKLKITKDLREYPMMRKKYKVIIDLYDGTPAPDGTTRIDQQKAVQTFLDSNRIGVIRAGPRSGKTLMAVAISVIIGGKTLIVIDSADLIKQFWQTYCGDGTERVRATNIPPERVIIINKMEDFIRDHDVALITYQKLIRETADDRIKAFINGRYTTLIGDEVHGVAAQAYANMLLKLNMPIRLGLTATPKRKDGRYCCQAGSQVVMADNNRESIENIKIGDIVKCYNHNSEIITESMVSAIHTRPSGHLVEIQYEGGKLRCTPDHEFWCENRQAYVHAKDLTEADIFIVEIAE